MSGPLAPGPGDVEYDVADMRTLRAMAARLAAVADDGREARAVAGMLAAADAIVADHEARNPDGVAPRGESVAYLAISPAGTITRHATFAQANGRVLEGSGLGRIMDAVGWIVRSTMPHATRIELRLLDPKGMADLGRRPRRTATWSEANRLAMEAARWGGSRDEVCVQVEVEFSDGSVHRATVRSREDEATRCGQRIALGAVEAAFSHLARDYDVTDCRWIYPE